MPPVATVDVNLNRLRACLTEEILRRVSWFESRVSSCEALAVYAARRGRRRFVPAQLRLSTSSETINIYIKVRIKRADSPKAEPWRHSAGGETPQKRREEKGSVDWALVGN